MKISLKCQNWVKTKVFLAQFQMPKYLFPGNNDSTLLVITQHRQVSRDMQGIAAQTGMSGSAWLPLSSYPASWALVNWLHVVFCNRLNPRSKVQITYGYDTAYSLKSYCGVRGCCWQKWVLNCQTQQQLFFSNFLHILAEK